MSLSPTITYPNRGSQSGDHRLSTSFGVVEWPDHHCGDDLVNPAAITVAGLLMSKELHKVSSRLLICVCRLTARLGWQCRGTASRRSEAAALEKQNTKIISMKRVRLSQISHDESHTLVNAKTMQLVVFKKAHTVHNPPCYEANCVNW